MSDLTRTFVCPQCGYDGFRAGEINSTIDVNVQWGCPRCMTVDGLYVVLQETSDPRQIADEDECACGHPHTAGRHGTCSSFLCPCLVWRVA